MSTTIYNGYQLNVENGIYGVQSFWANLHDRLETFRKELFIKRIVEFSKNSSQSVYETYDLLKEEYEEDMKKGYRSPFADFDFKASFFVCQNSRVLLLLYAEQRELHEFFESHPEVSYYGYWNNTEPDEEVSEEEWEQRKADWDEALPGIGVPRHSMMQFPDFTGLPIHRYQLKRTVKQYFPEIEESLLVDPKSS
ncbi:hypothetical protein ACFYKX_10820 [Cytobacillus sp. FJAT-54145]|uniref:Uncharacterized protein n=1 Tax=Cytobacillus spartinae TaxID=3299023 RepID=A0ABW6KEE9_9BACI